MDAVAYALAAGIPATISSVNVETTKASLPTNLANHGQSTLGDGTVLVTGGSTTGSDSQRTDIVRSWSPTTNSWTQKSSLITPRWRHRQSTLADGTALVAAGETSGQIPAYYYRRYVQQYNPTTNVWSNKAQFPQDIYWTGQSTLGDGTVLVTGGYWTGTSYNTVRSWSPTTNSWTTKASLNGTRRQHGQSTLADGTALVTGGWISNQPSSDVRSYDPSTNAWTQKTSMPATAHGHGQSTVGDGTVLTTGGPTGTGYVSAACYSYDPATNTWTTKIALSNVRIAHGQSTLGDGTVLLTGGSYTNSATGNPTSGVQQYDPGLELPTPGRAALLGYLAAN